MNGLTEKTDDYLSDLQISALLNGRYRGDGRPLDDYITDEPVGIEL